MNTIEKAVAYQIADIYEAKIAAIGAGNSLYWKLYVWIVKEVTLDLQGFMQQVEARSSDNVEGKAIHNALLRVSVLYQELMLEAKQAA